MASQLACRTGFPRAVYFRARPAQQKRRAGVFDTRPKLCTFAANRNRIFIRTVPFRGTRGEQARRLNNRMPTQRNIHLWETIMCRFASLLLLLIPPTLAAQTKDGFVPLFNGKDLDGWEV